MIALQQLDHLVLTVSDVEATCEFYSTVLGCQVIRFKAASGEDRVALRIGDSPQKINLHSAEHPFQPAAQTPQPGFSRPVSYRVYAFGSGDRPPLQLKYPNYCWPGTAYRHTWPYPICVHS